MRYYRYRPDANTFAGIGFEWEIDSPEEKRVLGIQDIDRPVLVEWTPPAAREFEEKPLSYGDFPSLSNCWRIPVVSQRAWNVLRPLIGYCCEALPIVHPSGEPFYLIHVMETIDALDEGHSETTRNATTGRINRIYRYALKNDLLAGKHIFKLPLESSGELLVGDEFRKIVEEHSLRGLLFKPVPLVG